jgi:hypothetical protein
MRNALLTQLFAFGLTSFIPAMPSFAEQACVRIQNGKLICGELVPKKSDASSKPSDSKVATQSQMGLDFTLEGCKKAKAGLYCSVSIYNSTDFDKQLGWFPDNVLIDSESRQYTTSIVKLGNSNMSGASLIYYGPTLPPKAKIKSQIFFRPSNGLSNYVRVLTIKPIIERNNDTRLTFRDFNVTQ